MLQTDTDVHHSEIVVVVGAICGYVVLNSANKIGFLVCPDVWLVNWLLFEVLMARQTCAVAPTHTTW